MIEKLTRNQSRKVNEFFERWTAFEPPPLAAETDSLLMMGAVHLMHTVGVKDFEVILTDSPHATYGAYVSLRKDSQVYKGGSSKAFRAYDNLRHKLHTCFEEKAIVQVSWKIRQSVDRRIPTVPAFKRNHDVVVVTEFENNRDPSAYQKIGLRGELHNLFGNRRLFDSLLSAAVLSVLFDEDSDGPLRFEGLLRLMALSPCVILLEKKLLVSRTPVEVCRDHGDRIHATDRPAITFADGKQASAIEGIAVKNDIFDPGFSISAQMILDEENMEVRRLLMDRFGIDPFLAELGAEVVAVDDYGILYAAEVKIKPARFPRPGEQEPARFVRLLNSTPEPGTTDDFKEYLLRVPPTLNTPRAAVAWSFGIEEEGYDPVAES